MSTADPDALEAEILRLEEELAAKRMAERKQQLEAELAQVQQETDEAEEEYEEEYEDDEEYEEEEYYEEEEEVTEVEEEEVEPVQEAPQPSETGGSVLMPKQQRNQAIMEQAAPPKVETTAGMQWPPQRKTKEEVEPQPVEEPAPEAAPEPKEVAKPRKKWIPLSKRDPEAFARSKAASAEKTAKKNAAAAAKPAPKPIPFKARKIPNVPESPAGQETPMELLLGPKLWKQGKIVKTTTTATAQDMELIGLYFGKKWGPDCKQFTPLLMDLYMLAAVPNKLEMVYISHDRSLNEFKEIYGKFPFQAMPTGTQDYKNALAKHLHIVELPVLVILDASTGHVVTTEGVQDVQKLERYNGDQANALIQKWIQMKPKAVPMDQLVHDRSKLLNGGDSVIHWLN